MSHEMQNQTFKLSRIMIMMYKNYYWNCCQMMMLHLHEISRNLVYSEKSFANMAYKLANLIWRWSEMWSAEKQVLACNCTFYVLLSPNLCCS